MTRATVAGHAPGCDPVWCSASVGGDHASSCRRDDGLPRDGRPTRPHDGSESIVGIDGNAYVVMHHVGVVLRNAGASDDYIKGYVADATSGDYDHLLAVSIRYLDAEVDDVSESELRVMDGNR